MLYHVLITRFNLVVPSWEENREHKPDVADREAWLAKRIDFFLEYCLPSVLCQTKTNFEWYIFFESGTEASVAPVLDALKSVSHIRPMFISGMDSFLRQLPRIVMDNIPENSTHILSSRLDNDDALHKNYIKHIQQNFATNQNKVLIDFPHGLCLDVLQKKVSTLYFPSNQFITLVEKVSTKSLPKLVYAHKHNQWPTSFTYLRLPNKNLWLQIVHGTNVVNAYSGQDTYKSALKGYPKVSINFPDTYNWHVFKQKVNSVLRKFPGYYLLKRLLN